LDILFISELLAPCRDWHDLFNFPIDPNGGFWYFVSVFVLPLNDQANNLTVNFWGIYEMDFPEDANVKAPREFKSLLGPFLFLSFIKRRGGELGEENGLFGIVNCTSSCHGICAREG
jgi:hypothetical protein